MQKVCMTKENFNSLPKNELLTLEQALWFTQDQGFIPLPRKADKKKISIIFIDDFDYLTIYIKKRKILAFRISNIIQPIYKTKLGCILALELEETKQAKEYCFFP